MAVSSLSFRSAIEADLDVILRMLVDDPIAAERERYEQPLPPCYLEAFRVIDQDPDHTLLVAELDGQIVGVLHLTVIQNLIYRGGRSARVESVRIASEHRGQGFGRSLMQRAIARAKERDCRVIHLMTNKRRHTARQFYEELGFEASHEGMKLHLDRCHDGCS